VTERRRHPLPGEVVRGVVAVEEVGEEPAGTGLPGDATEVDDVRGNPHACVVVEIAGFAELDCERVDTRQSGVSGGDVLRELFGVVVRREASFVRFKVAPHAVAEEEIQPLVVITPRQLGEQLLDGGGIVSGDGGVADFSKGKQAVADVGGEAGYAAVEVAAGGGVAGEIGAFEKFKAG